MTRLSPLQTVRPSSLFDDVRAGFALVAELAQSVQIRHDRLEAYAASLPDHAPANVFDPAHHYRGDAESTAAYVLALDSINFGSGYVPHLLEEGWTMIDRSLYYTVSSRLKHYFEQDGILSASQLRAMTPEQCGAILEMRPDRPYSAAFLGLCVGALQELGARVAGGHQGRFLSFVESARGSADAMLRQLVSLHNFNDVHQYRGHSIPFYKRAQITAADLQLAFRHLGTTLFSDIGHLTMFADNAVPHVLRTDGILEYAPDLAARIDAGLEIPSGSAEEIEIRACAGHVVELLAARKGMIAMDLDHILWHRSVEDARYRSGKTHHTLSQFY